MYHTNTENSKSVYSVKKTGEGYQQYIAKELTLNQN